MKQYIPIVVLISAMVISAWVIPTTFEQTQEIDNNENENEFDNQGRSWRIVQQGALGDLDMAYDTGNTSIIAVWVVNHTTNQYAYGNHSYYTDVGDHHAWQNDSTEFNNSVNVYDYAQKSGFDLEVPHSTAYDIIFRVRANATNAATGTGAGDQFNASWVSLNVTGYGIYGDVSTSANWTRYVTHNVSGDPAMYINFVYNGTEALQGELYHDNVAIGTGDSLVRDNRTYLTSVTLSCYY